MARRIIILLCFFSRLHAQETATAVFDSAIVETGEAFRLHIKTDNPPDTLDLSSWDTLLSEKQVLKRSGWYKNGQQWQSDLTFIAFDAAELDLPPVVVRFKDGRLLPTNTNHLTILATPVPSTDLNDMADIKDIHREAKNWTDYIWIYWLLGGLLVIILVIYWLTRKKKPAPVSRFNAAIYREQALKKLQQLEQQQLWQNGHIKTYYADLTFIVREFIGLHLRIKALESTTDDLVRQINRLEISSDLKSALTTLLQNADLAKFAKGLPETEYHPQAMADARRLVQSFQTSWQQ